MNRSQGIGWRHLRRRHHRRKAGGRLPASPPAHRRRSARTDVVAALHAAHFGHESIGDVQLQGAQPAATGTAPSTALHATRRMRACPPGQQPHGSRGLTPHCPPSSTAPCVDVPARRRPLPAVHPPTSTATAPRQSAPPCLLRAHACTLQQAAGRPRAARAARAQRGAAHLSSGSATFCRSVTPRLSSPRTALPATGDSPIRSRMPLVMSVPVVPVSIKKSEMPTCSERGGQLVKQVPPWSQLAKH